MIFDVVDGTFCDLQVGRLLFAFSRDVGPEPLHATRSLPVIALLHNAVHVGNGWWLPCDEDKGNVFWRDTGMSYHERYGLSMIEHIRSTFHAKVPGKIVLFVNWWERRMNDHYFYSLLALSRCGKNEHRPKQLNDTRLSTEHIPWWMGYNWAEGISSSSEPSCQITSTNDCVRITWMQQVIFVTKGGWQRPDA